MGWKLIESLEDCDFTDEDIIKIFCILTHTPSKSQYLSRKLEKFAKTAALNRYRLHKWEDDGGKAT